MDLPVVEILTLVASIFHSTHGGKIEATNVKISTTGKSCATLATDRGEGIVTCTECTLSTAGAGSPLIYSTGDITVSKTEGTATGAQAVVVEGKNSVDLNNVTMESTNTKLNGNSETYKSIFIYQSMSGDADVGTSSFTAKDSKIINNKGEIIFVTNTSTVIDLENNEIINNDKDGAFIKIGSAKWGTSGKNGGEVVLNAKNQKIEGDILIDNIYTLDLSLKNESSYSGTINNENTAKTINISLDSSSTLTLTGDSYITALNNEVTDNSNINLNGYTLYVNGTAITSTNYKGASNESSQNSNVENSEKSTQNIFDVKNVFLPIITVIVIICVIIVYKKIKNK